MKRAPTTAQADRICQRLKSVIHPTRLAVLMALRKGPRNVTQLAEALEDVSQSNLSQHLAHMRMNSVVTVQREGTQAFYAVANERIYAFIDLMKELFCD